MPLEPIEGPGTHPDDLNTAWPLGTDSKNEGDNHLRGIKSVIANTLIKLTGGAVDGPLYDSYEPILPVGSIIPYAGLRADIPSNWVECDGANGTPDLRSTYLRGIADTDEAGDFGGSNTVTDVPEHTHDAGSLVLPPHNHGLRSFDTDTSHSSSGGSYYAWASGQQNNNALVSGTPIANSAELSVSGTTAATGATDVSNEPKYYTVIYIMRVA